MKKRSLKFVIAGSILALLLLAFGVLFVTSNTQPADFRTHTGTVAEFDWHDERWYEGLLGNSQGSRLSLTLEDGSHFEATGIFYDQLSRELVSELTAGEEITISFHANFWNPNKICGIQYQGEEYLSSADTLEAYYASNTARHRVGIVLILFALVLYGSIIVFCYKRRLFRKR